jgi:hypothetical protein
MAYIGKKLLLIARKIRSQMHCVIKGQKFEMLQQVVPVVVTGL